MRKVSSLAKKTVFLNIYYGMCQTIEKATNVPALVSLAQCAVESAWGEKAPGNNYFGIKADKSWAGEKRPVVTTEYHDTATHQYPTIISITPILMNGKKMYEYKVTDYFRVYRSPLDSFKDHGDFLKNNARYASAFKTTDPCEFAKAIAEAGYATYPNYAKDICSIILDFQTILDNPIK